MPREFSVKDSRYLLLTYPQTGEDFDYEKILNLCTEHSAECLIAREKHEDGGTHYHAFIDFGRKFSIRGTTWADIDGKHPNIEKVGRTPWRAFDYVLKDGDIVAGGAERPAEGSDKESRATAWAFIVEAPDRDSFLDRCRDHDPRALVCSWGSIARYLDFKYPRVPLQCRNAMFSEFDISGYPELSDWVDENLRRETIGR